MADRSLRIGVVGIRGIPEVPGGVEAHCAELYSRLAGDGVEVTVYAREPYVPEPLDWRGVRVVPLRSARGKGLEAATHTWSAIMAARRDRCDVVHVHSVGPALMLPLARILGMRTVFTAHAPDYLQRKWGPLGRAYLRMGERVGARWAHEVICVSEHHSAELERRYERPVHCLPNGAPSPRILPPGPLLRSLGLEGDDYVLFVGRLVPDKRVEDLAAAAAHLPAAVRVLVVGDAADTDEYASNLRRDSGDRVTFAGFRTGDDLAEVYSNARLFVLPSAVEGLSVSLLEALAYGIPCIASDIPANRQVLSGGEVGRLVPVGDVAGLRDEIAALWGDEAERARLSRLGKEHAARDYDWDAIAGETLRIVRSACDTGSAKA